MSPRALRGSLSISGNLLARGKLMQLVYLDEAGKANETHEPYLVVAGVIVNPDQKWRPLEEYFMELSKRCFPKHDGPPVVFHAMHIFHGTHLFPREEWSMPRRIKLLERLAGVPKEFGLTIVQGYAHRATVRSWLEQTSPRMTPKQIRAYTHAIAFFNAVRRVENYMFSKAKNEVAMLIAEDTPEIKQTIHALHKLYTDRSIRDLPENAFRSNRIVDAVHFATKDQSLLLQIADHCAFIMKRKIMKRHELTKAFNILSPQIFWPPNVADALAVTVKREDIKLVTEPGSISLGASPEIISAFDSLVQGIRAGHDKHNLSRHLQILREAQNQVFATAQGRSFLRARPTLIQQLARHQKSNQR